MYHSHQIQTVWNHWSRILAWYKSNVARTRVTTMDSAFPLELTSNGFGHYRTLPFTFKNWQCLWKRIHQRSYCAVAQEVLKEAGPSSWHDQNLLFLEFMKDWTVVVSSHWSPPWQEIIGLINVFYHATIKGKNFVGDHTWPPWPLGCKAIGKPNVWPRSPRISDCLSWQRAWFWREHRSGVRLSGRTRKTGTSQRGETASHWEVASRLTTVCSGRCGAVKL